MLKSHRQHFYAAVDTARQQVGDSAPLIADEAIPVAFPGCYDLSREEGCDDLLRAGAIQAIKTYIRKPGVDDRQIHMNDIASDVMPYVERLRSTSFFVPNAHGDMEDVEMKVKGFHVSIAELCEDPARLEAACRFMESKASEVRAEAQRLRELLTYLKSR